MISTAWGLASLPLGRATEAVEGIKVLSGFGETLAGTLLYYDSRFMARGPFCLIIGVTRVTILVT
jgi:hypothetical protein